MRSQTDPARAEAVEPQPTGLMRTVAWVAAAVGIASVWSFIRSLPEAQALAERGSASMLALTGVAVLLGVLAWRGTPSESTLEAYRRRSAAAFCLALLLAYPLMLRLYGEVIRSHARGELFVSAYVAIVAVVLAWLARRPRVVSPKLSTFSKKRRLLWLGATAGVVFFLELYIPYLANAPVEAWYDNLLWNWSVGRGVFTINDFAVPFPILGWHIQPSLLPVALLYLPFRTAEWLYFLQAAALASAVWPTFLLARRVLGKDDEAFLATLAFLAHPLLHVGQTISVAAEPFAVPLVAWALYAVESGRTRWFLALMLLAVGLKEMLAALAAGIGAWVWWTKPNCRREGLVLVIVSVLWLGLAMAMTRHFNGGASWLTGYSTELLAEPLVVFARLIQVDRLNAMLLLVLPWAFLTLADWRRILSIAPYVTMYVIFTSKLFDNTYLLPILPVLFAGTLRAITLTERRLSRRGAVQPVLIRALVITAIAAWVTLGPVRYFGLTGRGLFWPNAHDSTIASVARELPDASVAVSSELLRRFSRRAQVYEFPAPVPARDGRAYLEPLSRDAEWVIVDLSIGWRTTPDHLRASVTNLLAEGRYRIHMRQGPLLVLRRQ